MTRRQLEAARQFCEQVGCADLFEYLGCSSRSASVEIAQRLHDRQQWAEKQPTNDREAQNFLRHYDAIRSALNTPAAHLEYQDTARRTSVRRSADTPSACSPLLEATAQFLAKVDSPSLHVYLGYQAPAPSDDPPTSAPMSEELRHALEEKRKWAQAQQNNPKFRAEARLLMSSFAGLKAACDDPEGHLACQREKQRAVLLEDLGKTIRTMLGEDEQLTPELLRHFQRAAERVGLTRHDLIELLTDLGYELPSSPDLREPQSEPLTLDRDAPTAPRQRDERPPLARPPPMQRVDSDRQIAPRPDFAPRKSKVDPTAPRITSAATAPPVRRSVGPPSSPRKPSGGPPAAPRQTLEVVGQANYHILVHGDAGEVAKPKIRFLGSVPLPADIRSSVDWLRVTPDRLDPLHNTQAGRTDGERSRVVSFSVHADPSKMPSNPAQGTITVSQSQGLPVTLSFTAERRRDWRGMLLGAGLGLLIALAVIAGAFALSMLFVDRHAEELVVHVDPSAELVLLDGKKLQSDSDNHNIFTEKRPRAGEHELTVIQPNFKLEKRRISLQAGVSESETVKLVLDSALTHRPSANDQPVPPTSELRQATKRAVAQCFSRPGSYPDTDVTVVFLRDGKVGAVNVRGNPPDKVRECVRRRAAAIRYGSLTGGDYAQVQLRFTRP